MRIKTTRQEALDRAVEQFKWIVVKFCVVKPQYRSEFKVDNKFSFNKLKHAFSVVKAGKDKKFDEFTKVEYDEFKKFSKALNYTFGISSESLKPILHWYYDNTGKRVQLKISEIIEETSITFAPIKVINNGKLISKNMTTGKFETIASWKTKYIIADIAFWESLFTPNSNKIENITINGKNPTKQIIDLIKRIDDANNSEEFNKIKEVKMDMIRKRSESIKQKTNSSKTVVNEQKPNTVVKESLFEYGLNIGAFTVEEAVEIYKIVKNQEPTPENIERMKNLYFRDKMYEPMTLEERRKLVLKKIMNSGFDNTHPMYRSISSLNKLKG